MKSERLQEIEHWLKKVDEVAKQLDSCLGDEPVCYVYVRELLAEVKTEQKATERLAKKLAFVLDGNTLCANNLDAQVKPEYWLEWTRKKDNE